jgi:esterase/lipase superfamily enzyme
MERNNPAIPLQLQPMNREYHKWYSPNLKRDMELLIFGHAGDPVLFFPTRTARFYDYEDWQVIDALRQKIEGGAIQVYCLDSVDKESFYAKDLPPADRILRHLQYEKYVLTEVLGLIQHKNPHSTLIAAGCSLGAWHAANLAFKHPHLFHKVVGLSGRYDLTITLEHFDDLFDGYRDQNIYFNMPSQYIPFLHDPAIIQKLRTLQIVFVVGEKDIFLENNLALSNALWSRNIWNALHLWDGESHKARYWRHMVQLYL